MLKPLTKKQLLTFHAILAHLDPEFDNVFSVLDVWKCTNWSEPTVRNHMKKLEEKGWIVNSTPKEWESRYIISKEILL